MGTRATIEFKDKYEKAYVYRGHDGFPETVLDDLKRVIEKKKESWAEPMCMLLATCFVGETYDSKQRLPDYEITTGFHGDESYRYFVEWDDERKEWAVSCFPQFGPNFT